MISYDEFKIKTINSCKKHDVIIVRKKDVNGRFRYKEQCLSCGFSPFSVIKNPYKMVPDFDLEKYDLFYKNLGDNFKIRKEIEQLVRRKSYEDYLKSPEWKAKRLLRLEKDYFLCTECGENKAQEVHHLTYVNLFNENIEDLQSVCRKCHTKIHQI